MEKFFKSWLGFEEMITPKIITVIYWILMVLTISGSVISMFSGNILNFLFGLAGLIFGVIGVIGVRVGCELVILSFNIYKTLKKIADNQSKNSINAQTESE